MPLYVRSGPAEWFGIRRQAADGTTRRFTEIVADRLQALSHHQTVNAV